MTAPEQAGETPPKTEIRILATPSATGDSCAFVMYPPLYDGLHGTFLSAEEAAESPLPRRLFELEGVERVLIAPNRLTVFKAADGPEWSSVGKGVGQVIREHHASGEATVSDAVRQAAVESSGLAERVQAVLDTEINPAVAAHGGQISLLGVKERNVYIQMGGGCQGCSQSTATLRQGVETSLRRAVPEVEHIYDTTDHAAGTNPYYSG